MICCGAGKLFRHRDLLIGLMLALSLPPIACSQAQEDAAEAEPAAAEASTEAKPEPQTASETEVPLEHLQLLVKPLTKEELIAEADAWRDALKIKVAEIARLRIEVQKQKAAEEAGDATDEQAASQAAEIAEALPVLNEERAHLVDRLNVVLEELESKGGDVESYRQYTNALTGVGVDVTDVSTFSTVVTGWLQSEQGGQRWLWNIIKFLAIVAAFYFAAGIVSSLVRHGASRVKGASQLMRDFLAKFIRQALILVGLIVGLSALEVDITPLLAAIGAAGFVVGFALQGTLGNFASGLLILAYKPFDVGDVIEAAGVSGVVDSVSLFSTKIRTFDNKVMIVPNNDIWGGTITNATASDTRRVDMVFGIGYDDDIEKAQLILENIVKQHDKVLQDPAPVIKLNELADSSVNFIVRPWSKTEDYWAVYWDVTQQVKQQFDQNGISIPYPQRDLHVYQAQ